VEKVVETVTAGIAPPDSEEIRAYFESNPNQFKTPEMVKFRQIFCRTRKDAKKLYKRLRAGESLAHLAREHSVAPEAENGGEVGWVAKGSLDERLEKTLFSLASGEISPVTTGPTGYHVFEVICRRPAGFQAFSEVIRHIELKLIHRRRADFCRQWLRSLRTDFTVKVNQKAIDKLEFS
jgi:parvulin-like peptidyl-prolyl isomerase